MTFINSFAIIEVFLDMDKRRPFYASLFGLLKKLERDLNCDQCGRGKASQPLDRHGHHRCSQCVPINASNVPANTVTLLSPLPRPWRHILTSELSRDFFIQKTFEIKKTKNECLPPYSRSTFPSPDFQPFFCFLRSCGSTF